MHLLSPLLPRPSAPNLFGLLCYLCHERCHHRPWNPSQKLMGHASYHCLPWAFHRISDQPPVALCCHWLHSLSPYSITTALLSTLADSVPPALYLLICLHHKCDHAISCLSPPRSSPHLQGHVQSAPQVIGTVWSSSCSSLHGPSTDLTLATLSHQYSLDGPTSHYMTREGRCPAGGTKTPSPWRHSSSTSFSNFFLLSLPVEQLHLCGPILAYRPLAQYG